MISIVDYGMGNLRSVEKALQKVGAEVRLVTKAEEIESADKLVVPGVGAFGDAMAGLKERDLVEPIQRYAAQGRPVLGICLGMQIFFNESEEDPGISGLGLLEGTVRRFRTTQLKVPHMGWNDLKITPDRKLLQGLGSEPHVYFVHSYYVVPASEDVIAARTEYDELFASAVERGNIFGTQFHPEKSQHVGMRILSNFVSL